jgi:hypothetical protein
MWSPCAGPPMASELGKKPAKVQSVVRVGDGRGFVVEHKLGTVVITAAHCLPRLPPAHPASYTEERTEALLAPLGAKPTVWAECLFADPVADIAVLGPPDDQSLPTEYEAYMALMAGMTPLAIADAPKMGRERVPGLWTQIQKRRVRSRSFWTDTPGKGTARLLSLDGEKWITRPVLRWNCWLSVGGGALDNGMSGSPILSMDGKAIAVVSTDERNPVLRDCLPAWFIRR